MPTKVIFVLLMMIVNTYALPKSKYCIEGLTSGLSEKTSVELIQYDFEEKHLSKTNVEAGKFFFLDLDMVAEGVYKVVLNDNKVGKVYQFNLIIDKTENKIQFYFNPNKSDFPVIIQSEINKNWYGYLFKEKNRINDILKVKASLEKEKNFSSNIDEILRFDLEELKQFRLRFIEDDFNKWSTALVKNSTNSILFENYISKEMFWQHFQKSLPYLINTPIYQDIIQCYLIRYYPNANEDSLKYAYQEVITNFSENTIVNVWIIKYIIKGLDQFGNKNLTEYFSVKYNSKI